MRPRHFVHLLIMTIAGAMTTSAFANDLSGTYRCSSYDVSGGSGSCRNMQPIILGTDSTYQMFPERGTYKVDGDRIMLSESPYRGAGQLQNGNQIVFEYEHRGLRHTVVYLCRNCAHTLGSQANASAVAASMAPAVVPEVR